jgi:hypothetical protein
MLSKIVLAAIGATLITISAGHAALQQTISWSCGAQALDVCHFQLCHAAGAVTQEGAWNYTAGRKSFQDEIRIVSGLVSCVSLQNCNSV